MHLTASLMGGWHNLELTEHTHLALIGFLVLFSTFEAILLRLTIGFLLRRSESESESSPLSISYYDNDDIDFIDDNANYRFGYEGVDNFPHFEQESEGSFESSSSTRTTTASSDPLSSNSGHVHRHIYRFLY